MLDKAGIQEAFSTFMAEYFQETVIQSERASWGGSGYSVELFDDGTHRVFWNDTIGNLYDTPGVILCVPSLGEDYDPENGHFFDNVEMEMTDKFDEVLAAL